MTVDREARARLRRLAETWVKHPTEPLFMDARVVLALLADLDTAEQRAEKLAAALRELYERVRPLQSSRGPGGYDIDLAVAHAHRALAEHGDVS